MVSDTDRQRRAYRSAAQVMFSRMASEAPQDLEALRSVRSSDIVVVRGIYDHVELVLDALKMPYTAVDGDALERVELRPEQLLVVNCPGQVSRRVVGRIRSFVAAGGSLFTTDWALRHVLEPTFPGMVAYNDRPTRDDVVRIEILDRENPFLKGVMDGSDDPQWWLEGSSYPIRVLDPDRVQILIRSTELRDRYGDAPVALVFDHGEGDVFHMVSHYFLQRTELRNERHAMAATAYAVQKGVTVSPAMAMEMQDLALGEVEAAASSARLFGNIVARKKLRARRDRVSKA